MSEIFISYAREDIGSVEPLAKALEAQGWSVWWDPKILAGMAFDSVIEEAIESARCVIVVWSNESVNSNWVRTEAGEGADRNILIPVLIEEVRIPLAFRRIQAVRLINWDGSDTHPDFNQLLQAISRLLGRVPRKRKQRARAKKVNSPEQVGFEVGDIIEQYRYFDGGRLLNGQDSEFKGTKWKVLAITSDTVLVESIAGIEGNPYWEQSEVTKNAYPDRGFVTPLAAQTAFDEFRRVNE